LGYWVSSDYEIVGLFIFESKNDNDFDVSIAERQIVKSMAIEKLVGMQFILGSFADPYRFQKVIFEVFQNAVAAHNMIPTFVG